MANLPPPPNDSPLVQAGGAVSHTWARWLSLLQSLFAGYSPPSGTQAPTFQNGWVDFGGSFAAVEFWRGADGLVRLRGLMKSGAVPSTAFTLPTGFRPASTEIFHCNTSPGTSSARLDVQADGQVVVQAGSNVWVSLSGVAFPAAS